MQNVIRPMFSRSDLIFWIRIVYPATTFVQHEPNSALIWHRGHCLFARKILHLHISGSCGKLSWQNSSITLHGSSDHLVNLCHADLLHFVALDAVLHDSRHLYYDFCHVRLYVIFLSHLTFDYEANCSHSLLPDVVVTEECFPQTFTFFSVNHHGI